MMEFHVFLSNNKCEEIYPWNRQNNFTVLLNQRYHLKGFWKVALTEVCLTPKLTGENLPTYLYVSTDITAGSTVNKESKDILRKIPLLSTKDRFFQIYPVPYYIDLIKNQIFVSQLSTIVVPMRRDNQLQENCWFNRIKLPKNIQCHTDSISQQQTRNRT